MGTACYTGHLAVVPSAPTSLSWFPNLSYVQCQPTSSLHAFTQASPSPGMHSPSPFLPFANSYNRFKTQLIHHLLQEVVLSSLTAWFLLYRLMTSCSFSTTEHIT